MLSTSLEGLATGWFSGPQYGGGRSYSGRDDYFSMEGFPPEAYTMPPNWETSDVSVIAQQVIAESVRGELPVANTSVDTYAPIGKMLGSMQVAALPAELLVAGIYTPAAIPLILPIIVWLARAIGVSVGALGIVSTILGLFEFGRIFIYIEGKSYGSMPPEVAWAWWYQLRQDRQRTVRLRMEGADKGGFQGAIPPYRGYDSGIDDGKSFLEKINPFEEGSFGDRLNPFVIDPDYFSGSNPIL